MKKIIVKQIFGAHQMYQEMVNFPPEGIEYLGVSSSTKKGEYYQSKKLKEFAGEILRKFKLPRMIIVPPGEYDIIHSSRGIIPIQLFGDKPWVIDMEHVHSFFGLDPKLIKNKFWKKFIENRLASDSCKAILCHCEATRHSFFHYLDCSRFKDKIKVLYPASHTVKIKRERRHNVRFLAVLSLFDHKGGPQILEAFSRLEKKYYNIELWIKSDVPSSLKKKYSSKNIKYFPYFSDILPRDEMLGKFHAKCDVFLYPTFTDSFGYGLVDALVTKMAIISTNLFAVPEIVEEGKNGLLVKIPNYTLKEGFVQEYPYKKITQQENEIIISGLVRNMEKLVKNKKIRDRMAEESLRMAENGRFSIEDRNKKLGGIYRKSVK